MKTYHPQLVKCSLPRPMTSSPNWRRSASPRLRNTSQGHDYPSGRRSASPRSLNFFSRHASCQTSPTPKLTHPSSPTQTSLTPQMQQYNEQKESDTEGGHLNRSKRSQTVQVRGAGVTHLTKSKPLRGRKSMSTLSPGSRGREYRQCHSTRVSRLCSHSSNSTRRTSNS